MEPTKATLLTGRLLLFRIGVVYKKGTAELCFSIDWWKPTEFVDRVPTIFTTRAWDQPLQARCGKLLGFKPQQHLPHILTSLPERPSVYTGHHLTTPRSE
ncbi:MAG: hypothetical protein R6X27_04590 [Candidatus Desulfacyla sp.]